MIMIGIVVEKIADALGVNGTTTPQPCADLCRFECSECGGMATLLICGKCRDCASELHEWAYEKIKLTDNQRREMRRVTSANSQRKTV
jgi:hypothetical protein